MKAHFYYDPRLQNDKGIYWTSFYLDDHKSGIYLGNVSHKNSMIVMLTVRDTLEFLNEHFSRIPFLTKKRVINNLRKTLTMAER